MRKRAHSGSTTATTNKGDCDVDSGSLSQSPVTIILVRLPRPSSGNHGCERRHLCTLPSTARLAFTLLPSIICPPCEGRCFHTSYSFLTPSLNCTALDAPWYTQVRSQGTHTSVPPIQQERYSYMHKTQSADRSLRKPVRSVSYSFRSLRLSIWHPDPSILPDQQSVRPLHLGTLRQENMHNNFIAEEHACLCCALMLGGHC